VPRLVRCVAAAIFLAAGAAGAQGLTDADTLFRDGRTLMKAGNFTAACPKFAESERLDPAPGTLLNLAECETQVGAIVSAREHFGLAASGFPRGDPRRTVALERAAGLEARIAHLTIHLAPTAPANATVRKGGVLVDHSALDQPMNADPGPVKIVVSAPGRIDRTFTLTLADGATAEQLVDVGNLAPPRIVVAAPPPPKKTLKRLGFVSLAVGGAGLVAGGITGALALSKGNVVKANCSDSYVCNPTGFNAASSGSTFATVSTATFIGGGVFAAAGGVFLFLAPKSNSTTTALVPFFGPGSAGAFVTRSF